MNGERTRGPRTSLEKEIGSGCIVSPIRKFHPLAPASGFAVDHTERSQAKLGDMKRVVILGPGASGKSTLAVRLGEITGLSVIELDKIFWRPGLVPTPRDQWVKIQQMLVEENGWIMDGDLGSRMTLSRSGFVLQTHSFSWTSRSCDALGEHSGERADFWLSLLRYRRQSRPVLMDAIADHAANATFHVLRNPEALRRFVADVVRKYRAGQPRPGS